MPSEVEEVVGFISHPNPQVRELALENLVPFSTSDHVLFKAEDYQPVKNLKLLIRDNPKNAEHVLTILVNLSGDREILEILASDDKFLDTVVSHVTSPTEPNADLLSMLLANLAKWDGTKRLLDRKQKPPEALGSDELVINQLMDLFVKGADGSYNKSANYDYLAYLFADLAKHAEARSHFLRRQDYDGVVPLAKIRVFTEHATSAVRRQGVASTLKNVAFDVPGHAALLAEDDINVLPYVLLPIAGGEQFDEDETMDMLPDLQLLPPDKKRDPDPNVVRTHVETLTLLTSTREGRDLMRRVQVYPLIRETHLHVDDEGVREACDRLVQVLMRDEEPDDGQGEATKARIEEIDDQEEIMEI